MITQQEVDNIVNSVNYNLSGVENMLQQRDDLKVAIEDYQENLKEFESRISFLADTKVFYVKAIDIMYEESIGALKATLNTALQYIISDKDYSCNLALEDKRGTKNLQITICDNDSGLEVDWKHGVGQGVRAVISFVLKMFYLINKGSKIALVDEKYSTISEQYVTRFSEFATKLCHEKGICLVLITHDLRFMDCADKTYLVADGNIREQKEKLLVSEESTKEEKLDS